MPFTIPERIKIIKIFTKSDKNYVITVEHPRKVNIKTIRKNVRTLVMYIFYRVFDIVLKFIISKMSKFVLKKSQIS